MHVLILEASTSAAKAMLYDTDTHTGRVETVEYPADGSWGQQQDAEAVYDQLAVLSRKIAAGVQVDLVSLITTWHGLLLCDMQMQPRSPVYLWSYLGAAELCRQLRQDIDLADAFHRVTGCQVNASFPYFKILHLQEQGQDLSEMLLADQGVYLNARLTGVFATSQCMASGSGLVNVHTGEYDALLLARLDIRETQLPHIFPSDTTFPLREAAAKELGLQAGIPVLLAYSDGGANQVGAGALQHGVMTLSVGTSGAMRMHIDTPQTQDNTGLWCYRSPKGLLGGAATSGACNCINWARETLFDAGTSFAQMEERVHDMEPPIFLPFLFGERAPGWNDWRKGGFYALQPEHTAQDKYLAVQEGVLYNLYQCYEQLCAVYGVPGKIRLSGGILNSSKWTQMCADMFGQELEAVEDLHSSLMGGAVMGMEKLGVLQDAAEYQPPIQQYIRPNLHKKAYYNMRYSQYLQYYRSED